MPEINRKAFKNSEMHRAELVRKFDLAVLRVVGLRQSVIGGMVIWNVFSAPPQVEPLK
jgi:hypothetical protein